MKSTLSLALVGASLVAHAYAGSEATRLLATQQLEEIQSRTENLTNSIIAWDANGHDSLIVDLDTALSNIHAPTQMLVSYLGNATEALKKVPTTFDLTQSFVIASPTQRLAYAVNHSIAALNSKQPKFYDLATQSVVIGDLQDLLYASTNYSAVLLGYVPSSVRPVADRLDQQIVDSISMGQTCYAKNDSAVPACNTNMVNPNITFELALKYGAIKPNGYPIA